MHIVCAFLPLFYIDKYISVKSIAEITTYWLACTNSNYYIIFSDKKQWHQMRIFTFAVFQ